MGGWNRSTYITHNHTHAHTCTNTQIALTEARRDRWGHRYPLMSHLTLAFEPTSTGCALKPHYINLVWLHRPFCSASSFPFKKDCALPGNFRFPPWLWGIALLPRWISYCLNVLRGLGECYRITSGFYRLVGMIWTYYGANTGKKKNVLRRVLSTPQMQYIFLFHSSYNATVVFRGSLLKLWLTVQEFSPNCTPLFVTINAIHFSAVHSHVCCTISTWVTWVVLLFHS